MHHVARNAAWNVGGQLVSLGVGLVALPILLHALGAARLGVFTLALGLIGFSGLFDLGLSRARHVGRLARTDGAVAGIKRRLTPPQAG